MEFHPAGLLRQVVELHLSSLSVEVPQDLLILATDGSSLVLRQLLELVLVSES